MPFPPIDFDTLPFDTEPPAYIPVIDYNQLVKEFNDMKEGPPGSHQAKLRAAVESPAIGAFYIKNPPVNEQQFQALANKTREFLSLPADQQAPYYAPDGQVVGLVPFGLESTEAAVRRGQGGLNARPLGADQCMKYGYELDNPHNKWPNQELQILSENFMLGVFAYSQHILKWVADLYPPVDEQVDPLHQAIEGTLPLTRYLHYSAVGSDNDSAWKMHEHEDISMISVSHRIPAANGFQALEYKVGEAFQSVPVLRDTSLVHFGGPFAAYYDGKIKAAVHRVGMPPINKRGAHGEHTSVLTFTNAGKNAIIPPYRSSYYNSYQRENDGDNVKAVGDVTAMLGTRINNLT